MQLRNVFLTILFLGAAGALPAAETTTELPKDVPYSDENTGVVFPPVLAKKAICRYGWAEAASIWRSSRTW